MLAHLKNKERLCCCQGPVAYAHRQRSVALRAKTKQPVADLRLQNFHFKNQQSSLDNHQSVAGKNAGAVARFVAKCELVEMDAGAFEE
jgi:hypothetical protein